MSDQSFPITPGGLTRLRASLKRIKQVDRPQNVKDIEEALEHGDLKENAEYHAAKEAQAKIDARSKYLEHRIAKAVVIDPTKINSDTIAFGATVSLCDNDTDKHETYILVGEDETEVSDGKISISAPLARALLGKEEGDEVIVSLPRGQRDLEILKIEYKPIL